MNTLRDTFNKTSVINFSQTATRKTFHSNKQKTAGRQEEETKTKNKKTNLPGTAVFRRQLVKIKTKQKTTPIDLSIAETVQHVTSVFNSAQLKRVYLHMLKKQKIYINIYTRVGSKAMR